MLKFLKALFGKTSAQPVVEGPVSVKLTDYQSWLSGLQEPARQQVSSQITASKQKINQLSATIKEKITALQSSQLMNPDIPDRAKDFMTGNRDEYTRRVQQYLDKLILPENPEALQSFIKQHTYDAEEFTKGILRPFQILQEFFSHETKEITLMIADIEREIEALKTTKEQNNPEAYTELLTQAELLASRQRQLSGLENDKKELEKQNNLRTHEQKARDIFNNFEPALRKFYRMATRNVKLVEHYLRDPVGSLIEDLHLEILEAVTDIERLLKFDRIPLGDKKEYVLDAMSMLNKQFLGNWLREYAQLAKTEKDAQKAFDECHASKMLIKIQKLREDTKRNNTITEQKLVQLRKDIARINLNELKTKLEEKTNNTTGKTVTILL